MRTILAIPEDAKQIYLWQGFRHKGRGLSFLIKREKKDCYLIIRSLALQLRVFGSLPKLEWLLAVGFDKLDQFGNLTEHMNILEGTEFFFHLKSLES